MKHIPFFIAMSIIVLCYYKLDSEMLFIGAFGLAILTHINNTRK